MTTYAEKIASLPRYRSHKVIQAAKILEVEPLHISHLVLEMSTPDTAMSVPVDPEWLEKHKPEAGGYYVVYEDRHMSYSPAKAFEAGHTLIEEPTGAPTQGEG